MKNTGKKKGRMKRPALNEIPIDFEGFIASKGVMVTMSVGQWDGLLAAAYDAGAVLLELDEHEKPIIAYRRKADANG